MTLRSLAKDVTVGRRSATSLVELSLSRIEAARSLNAVVSLRADAAIEEASALDRRVAEGLPVGPFAGLPVLVKDVEDAAGLPTTFGSLLYADAVPAERNGLIAGRLDQLGAIIVGKTNTPEFASEGYTDNRVFGVTHNPWSPDWSPGGSSGGSAAALAAGLAAIATGTDVGGSVRIPAALCGLVGLKPTNGLIGRDPILPAGDLNNHGLFGTSVADVRLQLALLRGFTAGDAGSYPVLRHENQPAQRALVASYRMSPGWGPDPDVKRTFDAVIDDVEILMGMPVSWTEPEAIFPAGYVDEDLGRIVGTEHVHELGRETIDKAAELLDPVIRGYLEAALQTTLEEYLAARRRRRGCILQLDKFLGNDRLLLTPTLTVAGWLADGRLAPERPKGLPGFVYNTEPVNLTGHPAISLPGGRHANGVPFGFQVVGPRYGDQAVLDFASRWERARPWLAVADGYAPL